MCSVQVSGNLSKSHSNCIALSHQLHQGAQRRPNKFDLKIAEKRLSPGKPFNMRMRAKFEGVSPTQY